MAGIFRSQGVWSCGFDFLPNGNLTAGGVFDAVVNSCNVNATFARFAGKGINCNNFSTFQRAFNTNLASWYFGFAFLATNLPASGPNGILQFNDSGSIQCGLGYTNTGQFQFYKVNALSNAAVPSSPLGSPSAMGVLVPNVYNFLELLVTIDNSVGVLQLRVNGTQVINFSGNTRTTANNSANQLLFGASSGGSVHYFDDIYILDKTAASPLDTFLGNGRIQTDGPNADSTTGGLNAWAFTTPQGSDFANAANIPANVAQYDSSSVLNDRMSLRFPAITANKVYFLNSWISSEQDAAGTRQITPIYRSNAVDQVGDAIALSNGVYTYTNQASVIDPNTSAGWSAGGTVAAGACEIGVQTTT